MKISLVAFDDFTDIDLFLMWDLLNRVRQADWNVSIVGEKAFHLSSNGLRVSTHGPLAEANRSDVVLFASGKGTRKKMVDPGFLGSFRLDATRQLVGSQCSGALLLARLGFLDGIPATTHRIVQEELRALGVVVVDAPLVAVGNVATAGGCLAGLYLVAWVLERVLGAEIRRAVIAAGAPVGEEVEYDGLVTVALSGRAVPRLSSDLGRPSPTVQVPETAQTVRG